MNATPILGDSGWPHRPVSSALLSTVVYRSQAVREMSPPALRDLTVTSQERNRRESVTGLMLYDGGQFFQWLEGPPASLDRLMGSISQDPRHTSIEILNNQSTAARTFGEWNMKLAAQFPAVDPWQRDVIAPPPEIVEGLRSTPQAAPVLLTRLVPATRPDPSAATLDATRQMPLTRSTAETLKEVILSVVFPKLCDSLLAGFDPAGARARDLAELLISSQDGAALELLRELQEGPQRIGTLYANILEPAARRLGDLWSEDVCSEFDLTLGLCRLQTAVRVLTAERPARMLNTFDLPSVLIVPEPGEMHLLGSVLDNSILGSAGWAPQSEFPRNDRALQDLLSSSWYDVLDLSLSVALRREHWLPRVTQTIAQARRASQNPELVVVVGGRIFTEQAAAGTQVGANLTSKTAGNVDQSILRTLNDAKTATPSWELSREVVATPC